MDPSSLLVLFSTIVLCTVGVLIFCCFRYNRGPRVIKRTPSKTGNSTVELRVFREQYGDLQWAFQSPEVSAGNLYARGIIDEDVRDRAQSPYITCVKKSQILLNAVEQAIKIQPAHHFCQFLDVLANEPTTNSLYKRLLDAYNGTSDGDSSPSRQDSFTSKETQTIMPLPQRLQIHVPVHCATIKATNSEKKPESDDEKLNLAVSILDASSGAPLKCIVALLGDDHKQTEGRVICFLSVSINVVGENKSRKFTSEGRESSYEIWRSKRSDYSASGQATFYMCFYESDVDYIVTLNITKVCDEEGIECMGYTVEHYTGFISTVKTVERNAFRAPPLLKYEGPIASAKFNKLMSVYNQMFYQGKSEESNIITSKMTLEESTAALDVKLYMSISKATEKSFDSQAIVQLKELFQRCQSLDSTNGFLLQALIMTSLSQTHSFQGRKEKAL